MALARTVEIASGNAPCAGKQLKNVFYFFNEVLVVADYNTINPSASN